MGEFSLLSLNTFGIPFYLGWGRLSRLTRELDRLHVTAICLQEIQQNAYAHLIQRGLTSYPHSAYERYRYAPKAAWRYSRVCRGSTSASRFIVTGAPGLASALPTGRFTKGSNRLALMSMGCRSPSSTPPQCKLQRSMAPDESPDQDPPPSGATAGSGNPLVPGRFSGHPVWRL